MPNYLRYTTNNKDLEQVQDSVEKKFGELDGLAILEGKLLENIDVIAAVQLFPHGLGRPFKGWAVVDKTSDVRVWRLVSSTFNPDLSVFLPLIASGTSTLKVWVF